MSVKLQTIRRNCHYLNQNRILILIIINKNNRSKNNEKYFDAFQKLFCSWYKNLIAFQVYSNIIRFMLSFIFFCNLKIKFDLFLIN